MIGDRRRRWAGVLTAMLAGLATVPASGTAAQAHGADAPAASDYRTTVTGVGPPVPGVRVRVIEAGARLQLENSSGRTIEVLGEAGEPYLEIRPDGVHENVHSPATYRNATLTGGTPVPSDADPTRPPRWRKISDEPVARWHDRRTRWTGPALPGQVAADPSRPHLVREWVVPLRDGVRPVQVRGTLTWLPPPVSAAWWAGALLLAAVAAGLARVGGGRAGPGLLGAIAVVAGLGGLAYAVARQLDAGMAGLGGVAAGVLTSETWSALAALGAVAAGVRTLTRRPPADFPLTLAAVGLALFAGVRHLAVFGAAVAPAPGPSWWVRLAVAGAVGVGAGLAVGGMLRLRATGRHPASSSAEPAA